MKLGNVAGGKKLSCCDEIRNFRLLQLRGPFSSSGAWLGFTPPPLDGPDRGENKSEGNLSIL